jgi:N-acetylneuraminate synthase
MKKTFIIAEIAQAHDGSLGILHSYIDAAASAGADGVKFQMHFADEESSPDEKFRVKFSYQDKTRYDYWKRMEFSPEQWEGIRDHCDEVGVDFVCSPFSIKAVKLLKELGCRYYKIGSGEVTNLPMLKEISKTSANVIISSGMSSFAELSESVEAFKGSECALSLLQCSSKYPTQPEDTGLNILSELRDRFGLPVGLSDHSGVIYPCIAAATMGAEVLEAHIVFDKRMFGPDASSSLTVNMFAQMVEGVRFIDRSLNSPVDKDQTDQYHEMKGMFEKAICLNRNVKSGEKLTMDMITAKKPASSGIHIKHADMCIGKYVVRNIASGDFLKEDDIDG